MHQSSTPLVQFSGDIPSTYELALTLAHQAGVDIPEYGTPILKHDGLPAVIRHLNALIKLADSNGPRIAKVELDTKCVDGGAGDIQMAVNLSNRLLGASPEIIVVGMATHRETVMAMLDEANKWRSEGINVDVMADLMGIPEGQQAQEARRLQELGVRKIACHLSYDRRNALNGPPRDRLTNLFFDACASVTQTVGDLVSLQLVGGLVSPRDALRAAELLNSTSNPGAHVVVMSDISAFLKENTIRTRDLFKDKVFRFVNAVAGKDS